MINEILSEINVENGSNYKISVLKKYTNSDVLKKCLKMAYDRVDYTFGISTKNIEFTKAATNKTIDDMFDLLERLNNREFTGNAAKDRVQDMLAHLSKEEGDVMQKILNRDLRINIGKTQINKVWPDLITKPSYMRCGVYSKKTAKDITFPAIVELKSDGTYREASIDGGKATFRSRSGESYEYPLISKEMESYLDGVYTGELTVICDDVIASKLSDEIAKLSKRKKDTAELERVIAKYESYKKENREYVLPRGVGNGLINSDEPPHANIVFDVWDFITHDEYKLARKKDKKNPCQTPYDTRFTLLRNMINSTTSDRVRLIPYKIVDNLREALEQTAEWMNAGFEGSVLKDMYGVFKDGTSKHQLKLKLEIDCEMRIIGFHEGSKGTKREGKVGSIIFGNDEGTIRGKCSGFSDDELDDFTLNQDKYLDKIITVQCNDITKARGSDFYALSHPRFIEVRDDKDETDTLTRVFELREMAMELN